MWELVLGLIRESMRSSGPRRLQRDTGSSRKILAVPKRG